MPTINQPIPNFTGGVSQQPDSRKYPGQLKVCDNAVPDLTHGLIKRPPGEFLSKLTNANNTGFWYEILRDGDEKFLMQITPANFASNPIRVWNLTPITVASGFYNTISGFTNAGDIIPVGTEFTITENGTDFDYFNGCTEKPGVLSLQDYTLIANPQKTITAAGTPSEPTITKPDGTTSIVANAKYAFAELDVLTYNTEYILYNTNTAPQKQTYWRVTAMSVDWYDDDSDSHDGWDEGGDNDGKTKGNTFTKDHGYNPPDKDHGKFNGNLIWSMNAGGPNVFMSARCNADITHYGKTHNDAKTINGNKVNCFKLSSISADGNNNNFSWTVGDTVHINFNSRKDGSAASSTTSFGADDDFEVIHKTSDTEIWCWAPSGPGGGGGGDQSDAGQCTIRPAVSDVHGGLLVNSVNFQDTDERLFDNDDNDEMDTSGDAQQFLGYGYDTRYTGEVTLRSGGLIKCQNRSDAKNMFIDCKIEGQYWRVSVDEVEEVETYEGGGVTGSYAFYRTPRAQETGTLSAAMVLRNLQEKIDFNCAINNSGYASAQIVGTGLFINMNGADNDKSAISFVGGQADQGMTVISRTCRNISKLPAQCVNGYTVEVNNSENTESDNYYMKFIADNGNQGPGKWEECMRPNKFKDNNDTLDLGWDESTMPHALINNRNGTFTFRQLNDTTTDNYWIDRDSGDDDTNPYPSIKGKKIQQLFFHRNRLGLIAEENVIMSRPSDYFNLFNVSSITYTEDNPIDITVNDTKPAFIKHTLPYQAGILMFSDNGQFMLYSDAELFSAKTIRLKKLSSYESSGTLAPVDLGTSIMFASTISSYTRAFEARITSIEAPPLVYEHTNIVPEYVPKDVSLLTNSPVLGIATFGKKNSSELYHFKHSEEGNERVQAAWYTWTIEGTLEHAFYNAGMFYTVTKHGSDFLLSKHEYVTDIDVKSYTVGGVEADIGSRLKTARGFEGHLDCMVVKSGSDIVWTPPNTGVLGDFSTVKEIGYTPTSATDFYLIGLTGNLAGTVVKADSVSSANNGSAVFNGINLTGVHVAVGYKYTSTIELPHYYVNLGQGRYDTNADLRISGLNIDFGVSGPMEFHLTATDSYTDSSGNVTKAFDDHIQYESGMLTNRHKFNSVPSELHKSVRVPIYKKNKNYNLTIKLPDPFYTAILSGSWDGIYHQRRHVRQ